MANIFRECKKREQTGTVLKLKLPGNNSGSFEKNCKIKEILENWNEKFLGNKKIFTYFLLLF